jgi:hypothetical protein
VSNVNADVPTIDTNDLSLEGFPLLQAPQELGDPSGDQRADHVSLSRPKEHPVATGGGIEIDG